MKPSLALFEWTAGGHRPTYVRRFVEALEGSADVLLALPEPTLEAVRDLDVQTRSLGEPRPPLRSRLGRRRILARELAYLREVAADVDQTLHLFGDHLLLRLATTRRFPGKVGVILYYPRWHYPSAYGTPLPVGDRLVALAKELAVGRWRRRVDAGVLFTLDEELAERWGGGGGSPARWLPEPPVGTWPVGSPAPARDGCVLYGALAPRKGIDLVARALTTGKTQLRLVVAGAAEPAFLPELESHAAAMAAAGVEVELRPHPHSEQEGLEALAGARCALLPYPRHPGMSRVLLEACAVGTPVIADEFGLLGHLVRRHRLGVAVDCSDVVALRESIFALMDPAFSLSFSESLSRFSARYAPDRFRTAVLNGLNLLTDEPIG